MMMATVPFYYLTLETYYLGEMNLPSWSGPDDTQVAHFFVCMYTAYVGSQELYLHKYNFLGFEGVQFNHLVLYFLLGFEIISVVSGVGTNLYHARHNEYFRAQWGGKRYFFSHVTFMVSLCAVFMTYALISPVMSMYPKLAMFAYGSQFLQGTFLALISGATREHFKPYRRTNTFMWSCMILNGFSYLWTKEPLIDELYLMVAMNVIGWSAIMHQIYWTIVDFKRILNVRLFRIKTKAT